VTIRTPAQAVSMLATSDSETLAVATAYLRALPDLLPKQGKALADVLAKEPADVELAVRVLDLVRERDVLGCEFAAARIDSTRRGWLEAVLFRSADVLKCQAMSDALARVQRGLPELARQPSAVRDASRILEVAKAWRDTAVARVSCRFLLAGPPIMRRDVLDLLLVVRPENAGECLVQAYSEEAARAEGDAPLRVELLKALVVLSGANAVPTLRLALERPDDREVACGLLKANGTAAVEGLVFALRTSDARSDGVKYCLESIGVDAMAGVLPLLDHSSVRIRGFVIQFLRKFHSPDARDWLQRRFLEAKGPVAPEMLLSMLAEYPPVEVVEALREALSSSDSRMRFAGLDAIESSVATNMLAHLHEIIEGDGEAALRRRAIEVAWRLHDTSVLPLLRKMVTYEEPLVSTMALRVMGFMGGKEDAAVVAKSLGQKDPTVVAAAVEAAWLLSYQAPRKGKVEFIDAVKSRDPKKVREIACEGLRAKVLGNKGPLVLVLPGGPAMDLSYAWPHLADLSDDAVVAFLAPDAEGDGPGAAGLVLPSQVDCVRKALGGARAVLVSHGLGGTWASTLAAAAPDAVAGVFSIMAPLPGRLRDIDDALRAALAEPFVSLVAAVSEMLPRFVPEAANAYLHRLHAPAMAGRSEPQSVLCLAWDVLRSGRARELLGRPEVRVVPSESRARFLMVVPARLAKDATDAYLALAALAPDRVSVQSMEGCGFLPEVACTSKIIKAINGFVRVANAGAGK
jgi:pimeloyl-ACP methyl ester carboxylesterase